MSLDILYASIIKSIDSIGGFCLIPPEKIDYIKYFPVDATKIGVSLRFNVYANPWTRKNDDPRHKSGAAWCSNGDIIYMYGGYNGTSIPDRDLWSFNTITQVWTRLNDNMLVTGWDGYAWIDGISPGIQTYGTRIGAKMVYHNNKLYVYGGYPLTKGTLPPASDIPSNTLHIYDLSTDTWSYGIQNTAAYPSTDHGMVVSPAGIIYVYGGDQSSGVQRLNQHFKYNINAPAWTELYGLINIVDKLNPIGRQGCVYEYVDGYIYLYGGSRDGLTFNTSYFTDMYRFSTVTELWEVLGNGPGQRAGAEACIRGDGYMYMLGGAYYNNGVFIQYTDFWRYDYATDIWSRYYNSPTTRTSFTLEVNTNKEIWLVGEDVAVYMFQDTVATSDYVAAVKLAKG